MNECLHDVFSCSVENHDSRIRSWLKISRRARWDTSWRNMMSTLVSSWMMNLRISVTRSWVFSDNASMFHVKSTRSDDVLSVVWGGSVFSFAITGFHCWEFGLNWCQDWNFGSAGMSIGRGVLFFQDIRLVRTCA